MILPLFIDGRWRTRRAYSIGTYSTMMLPIEFSEDDKTDLTFFLFFVLIFSNKVKIFDL